MREVLIPLVLTRRELTRLGLVEVGRLGLAVVVESVDPCATRGPTAPTASTTAAAAAAADTPPFSSSSSSSAAAAADAVADKPPTSDSQQFSSNEDSQWSASVAVLRPGRRRSRLLPI
jgi:hypothetical protein